eukprot:ANDGO_06692.mRNA.1 hypothetical protein
MADHSDWLDTNDQSDMGHERELESHSATLHKQAFREESVSSKDAGVQHGFDQGFSYGSAAGYAIGMMQGMAYALSLSAKEDTAHRAECLLTELLAIDPDGWNGSDWMAIGAQLVEPHPLADERPALETKIRASCGQFLDKLTASDQKASQAVKRLLNIRSELVIMVESEGLGAAVLRVRGDNGN